MNVAPTVLDPGPAAQRANPFALTGKVALVTGSSRGIGLAIAEGLMNAGAHVVLHGRDGKGLAEAVDRFASAGLAASHVAADVTDEAAMSAAIELVVARHGRIDILVNNAGISSRSPLAQTSTDEWRRVLDVDLTACFFIAREAGRQMARTGWGRIINIASVAGLIAAPGRASYVAAKHGIIGLTRSLALEFGAQGITANAVAPGFIATELNADMRRDVAIDQWVRSRNPIGRWGRPEEIAGAAVYLSSPLASFVNGAVLVADGGMSAVV
jgi:gluconate 5-dehydrogenase